MHAGIFQRISLAPLAAAALGAATPASTWADARASVRLTDFGYSLIDLSPGDGITPAVRFNTDYTFADISAGVSEQLADANGLPITGQTVREGRYFSYFVLFPALSRSASLSNSEAGADMSGAVELRQFSASTHSLARNRLGDGLYGNRAGAGATPFFGGELSMEITPNTELVWSGHLRMEVEKGVHRPGTRFEWATATARLSLVDSQGTDLGRIDNDLNTARQPAGLYADEQDFRWSLVNDSGRSVYGRLAATMGAFSQAALPVPEPATPQLLLGGLAVLAGVVRRRRRAGATRARPSVSRRWAGLGALALLCAAAPARADLSALASVTRFGYSLVDLNPGDGIAPGISFAVRPGVGDGGSHAQARYVYEDNREGLDDLRDSSAMLLDMATAVSSPLASASARMGGSAASHAYAFTAQGSFINRVTSPVIAQNPGISALAAPADDPYGGGTSFRLTPFTQIVWTGDYSMRLELTQGRSGSNDEFASSTVFGSIYDAAGNAVDSFMFSNGIVAVKPQVFEEAGSLRLAFANQSADFAVAHLNVQASVWAQLQESHDIAAVPEPATVVLMLCGLAGVGAATRRARR